MVELLMTAWELPIAGEIIDFLIEHNKSLDSSRVLIMGITFKENVSDIRNSKVIDIIDQLKYFKINVEVIDPYASSDQVNKEYGFPLAESPQGPI